ncbi:hypothetical protein AB205_0193370 [Aquarana catesbeiana]|uniref:Protein canopy homolog 3 n=1 Tax=Aquarana catesbeiana TaxID=8400 RepID=A0A2G9RKH9_AQUCT|nr:hypothetical protein AB205_0193370 [Aquarana catesbeiana]
MTQCMMFSIAVCKYVAVELKSSFDETSRTHEVIDAQYGFLDGRNKKKIKYTDSDIRLIDVTEGLCQRLLEYNLHKERTGSNRFAKSLTCLSALMIDDGTPTYVRKLRHLGPANENSRGSIAKSPWADDVSGWEIRTSQQCRGGIEDEEEHQSACLELQVCTFYRRFFFSKLCNRILIKCVTAIKAKGCLDEKWSGKKGDSAPSSGKKKPSNKGGKKKTKKSKENSKNKNPEKPTAENLEVPETQPSESRPIDEL